jgi:hypothetical protein
MQAVHAGGADRGKELFRTPLEFIKPKVLIAHGAGTAQELGRVLNQQLPRPPERPVDPIHVRCRELEVFVIPSLAPPGWNKWSRWADAHLEAVAWGVAKLL